MSDIRKEFDEAFEKIVDNFISTDYDRDDQACGEIVDKEGLALWAAKWMAEYIAKESEKEGFFRGLTKDYQASKKIRQLAKELEDSK